jgi:hypothetical protein
VLCLFLVYDGARRIGQPGFFTCTNRSLQRTNDLSSPFKVMGLSSTVCLPINDARIQQSRHFARQAPFSGRSEQSGIYRSSKKESDRFSIQGIFSSLTGNKDAVSFRIEFC